MLRHFVIKLNLFLIFGLLICGFALWGVGDLTGGTKEECFSVENKDIPRRSFG